MWTLARFFDISKKPDAASALLLFGMLCLIGLNGPGCIVTDKIEFEDAVNRPISIERETPADSIVSVGAGDDRDFTVTVWDADEQDPDPAQNSIEANVEIRASYWSAPVIRECNTPELSAVVTETDTETETEAEKASLPRFAITCPVNLGQLGVLKESLLEVRIIVSDSGFYGNTPRQGAQTAEMLWVLSIEESN